MLANFTAAYKVIFYKLIVSILTIAIGYSIGLPLIKDINDRLYTSGIYQSIIDRFASEENLGFITLFRFFYNLLIVKGMGVIAKAIAGNVVVTVGLLILVLVIMFLWSLSDLAVCETVNGYMSSFTHYNFVASFTKSLKKSYKYSLIKMAISLPINIINFIVIYFVIGMVNSFLAYFTPFIALLIFMLINSGKLTLLSAFAPAVIYHSDKGVFDAFKESLKVVRKDIFRIFGTLLNITVVCIFINYIGFVLLGIGLVITIPITMLIYLVFNCVAFYSTQHIKYYVEAQNIAE
jgi:hypothetical protein